MESNIDEIIHKILENRSIEETIDVVPGFITTKQIYLTTNITILNYDYSDVKILKSQLYYSTKNIKMLISDTDHNMSTNKTTVITLVRPSQYKELQEDFNQNNIKIKIIGTTSMSSTEEQIEMENLEYERNSLQKSTIMIAKASFMVMHEHKDNTE